MTVKKKKKEEATLFKICPLWLHTRSYVLKQTWRVVFTFLNYLFCLSVFIARNTDFKVNVDYIRRSIKKKDSIERVFIQTGRKLRQLVNWLWLGDFSYLFLLSVKTIIYILLIDLYCIVLRMCKLYLYRAMTSSPFPLRPYFQKRICTNTQVFLLSFRPHPTGGPGC